MYRSAKALLRALHVEIGDLAEPVAMGMATGSAYDGSWDERMRVLRR